MNNERPPTELELRVIALAALRGGETRRIRDDGLSWEYRHPDINGGKWIGAMKTRARASMRILEYLDDPAGGCQLRPKLHMDLRTLLSLDAHGEATLEG